jgi:pimeloyl-ACP methyl ester carboxylesterase
MSAKQHDVAKTGSGLENWSTKQWLREDELRDVVIILVHGFTADASKFEQIAPYLSESGWTTALFSYDSYKGIDHSANSLNEMLLRWEDSLKRTRIAFVAHSMGGLVTRYFAQKGTPRLRTKIKAVVELGVPNRGTLTRGWPCRKLLLNAALSISESMAGINPHWRSPACRAAEQLICADKQRVVEEMNYIDARGGIACPFLTISGGLPHLEIASRSLKNRAYNALVQRVLNEKPNDGLVAESSANLSRALNATIAGHHHRTDYLDFATTNHTYLTHQMQVGMIVKEFLKTRLQ